MSICQGMNNTLHLAEILYLSLLTLFHILDDIPVRNRGHAISTHGLSLIRDNPDYH